jgi:hypothetical protein
VLELLGVDPEDRFAIRRGIERAWEILGGPTKVQAAKKC